jgi:hypothetical protein
MRITRFEAENFKRLKAVDITPDGNTVVIKGRNAQGKSSVLDGIMAALAGRNGAKELPKPIRDGEDRAHVTVELDDLVVTRKWTPSGSTVTVSPKGGNARLNSPQAVLDKLIGALTFDPLEFAEADAKSQVETLIYLIGREDFDAIATMRREAYDERTQANRDLKRVTAQYEGLGDCEPAERVNVQALSEEYGVAKEKVALRERWERLEAEMAEIRTRANQLPESRPVEVVNDLLSNAVALDEAARRYEDWKELGAQVDDYRHASATLTERIEALDAERQNLVRNADLPVEGLTFDEEGVEYNGVPFVQASAAERLKVSVGMAMALNPDLRVICIRDASLLDDDSKRALVALAEEHDYQIWYEVVGKAGEIGVVIEDGEVEA